VVPRVLPSIPFLLLTAPLLADPYGWFIGSPADSTPAGDRLAVVHLQDEVILGAPFTFTTAGPSAQAANPAFSPDGGIVYLAVSGSAGAPAGLLHVYRAGTVLDSLSLGQTPGPPFQTLSVAANEGRTVIPTSVVVSPSNTHVLLSDAGGDQVVIWRVRGDGTLDPPTVGAVAELVDPSAPWFPMNGARAYLATQQVRTSDQSAVEVEPMLRVLQLGTSSSLVSSIAIPAPTQTGVLNFADTTFRTQPAANVSFAVPSGTPLGLSQPAGARLPDDGRLLIFSGYAGFTGKVTSPVTTPITLTDDFHRYEFNTATNTLNPQPQLVDVASDQTVLPPFNSAYALAEHIGGTTMRRLDGSLLRVRPSNSDWMLLFGNLSATANAFYIGSVSVPNLSLSATGYRPVRSTSHLYRLPLDTTGTQTTLTPLVTSDRFFTTVVGQIPNKVVALASDGFLFVPSAIPVEGGITTNSQVVFLSTDVSTIRRLDLPFHVGAYAQEPDPDLFNLLPASTIADALLGLDSAPDQTDDGVLDAADVVFSVLNGGR
jgi:hypothetical protein